MPGDFRLMVDHGQLVVGEIDSDAMLALVFTLRRPANGCDLVHCSVAPYLGFIASAQLLLS